MEEFYKLLTPEEVLFFHASSREAHAITIADAVTVAKFVTSRWYSDGGDVQVSPWSPLIPCGDAAKGRGACSSTSTAAMHTMVNNEMLLGAVRPLSSVPADAMSRVSKARKLGHAFEEID